MTTFMSNKHERLSDERVSMLGWWEALGAALAYECAYDDDLADRLRENPTIAGALSALQAERRTQ